MGILRPIVRAQSLIVGRRQSFLRNIDVTLGQNTLDVTERQSESGVEPDRMLDDLGREAMTLE